ncbi:alpha/beta fold hydrolase [Crossiella cryophila]|uniref:Pimeloyl-ACP methyl ester carboxylesterase n=1 Tax=Crossiella cryophila TaxID=43355 RepID=A0A7W7CG95_9PSEU|nr:alpha/beta hydrolase [Crossiella cryophila]MBB4678934.1 pimeloyl-ACP methyl ester carboxylesterase [Crossiella cryophila]
MIEHLTLANGPHRHTAIAAGPADGELVLLLHGWPEFADCWTEHVRALAAAGYRAVAVDQRGYAPGARPPGITDYTVPLLVADALSFADTLGAARFHLIAHDWGGLVAWALASAHPERLRSLSVLATPHPVALREQQETDPDQHSRLDYVRFFQLPDGQAEASLLAEDAARLRAAYEGKVDGDLVARNVRRLSEPGALTATLNWYRAVDEKLTIPAGRIRTPTLYLWGSADRALGRGAALRTAEFVDAPYRLEILPGASHWLPEECANQTIPLLLNHLAAHPS